MKQETPNPVHVIRTDRGEGSRESLRALTDRQETVLSVLDRNGGDIKDLQIALRWKRSRAIGVVNKLIQKGYVTS